MCLYILSALVGVGQVTQDYFWSVDYGPESPTCVPGAETVGSVLLPLFPIFTAASEATDSYIDGRRPSNPQ